MSCGWKERAMFKELKESKPVCLENSEGEGGMSRGWRGMKKSRTCVSCPSVGIDSKVSEQILNGFMHMQRNTVAYCGFYKDPSGSFVDNGTEGG